MKYSLTPYSQTISNTSEGDIELTTDEVIVLINSDLARIPVPASGTTSGTLVLDCDLGSRVHVDEIQYFFDTPASGTEVMPYIKFYVKNESFDIYISLDTYRAGNYYFATISGTDSPRYVRVEHTVVSGYEGDVNGFKVMTDDTYVDFGEFGNKTFHNVNASIDNAFVQIDEMEVYNSGPSTANAKIILEPQNDVSDTVFAISNSSSGPWYGIYSEDDMVAGPNIWDTGTIENLQTTDEVLKLSSGKESGTYTTRIIKLDEYQKLTFSRMNLAYPVILPSQSFFDDFSDGGVQWTDTTDATYSSELKVSTNGQTSTIPDLNYGDDWMLTFRMKWPKNYVGPTAPNGSVLYPISSDTGFRIRFGIGGPFYSTWSTEDRFGMYVNGSYINWANLNGTDWARTKTNTWFNIKIQRHFLTVQAKLWEATDPEPGTWNAGTHVLGNHDQVDKLGKIQFITDSAQSYYYFDDFLLIKNYSATADAKSIVATDDIDTLENIEVRSSNSEPMPRTTYIELAGSYGSGVKTTQHRWMSDGSVAETSSDWGNWGESGNFWEVWYDSIREDEYIVDKPFYTGYYGNTGIYFRIRRKDGTLYSLTMASADYDYSRYWSTYKLSPDSSGGFWVYYFVASSSTANGVYYLRYYNSSLGTVYTRSATINQGTFLYDLDSVYYSPGEMWYSDIDLNTIFKINSDGTILASHLATDDVRGLFATEDGGCRYIQQNALVRLNSSGDFVDSIEIPTATASYVYSDFQGGFWLHDGWIVRHYNADNIETFNVEITDLYFITPAQNGVLAKHHDGSTSTRPKASFISKDYQKIMRTWDYPVNEGGWKGTFDYNRYGVRSHLYDDLTSDHASNFPITIDTQWNTFSEWKKVPLRDYNFTNDEYHQIRLTLRGDSSTNSPEIYGLYTQRAIEIPRIYPGNYGRFYLKSDISGLVVQDAGDYTSHVRAYWYLDVE